ncbi:redoxin domain-containing protein [Rhodohalobacter sp. 8-1]|uniref:redoxin domain-containing protein n=1 Tax=Rhodohalobacter sp. 8-1 TaxID=3131972 RepID=UPI0030ED3B4B
MALKAGDTAPDFTLTNTSGDLVSLQDLQQQDKGDILLTFFPLAFSSVCTDELCTMRDNMKLYNSLNTTVAAISADSFFVLKVFKKANNLKFPLLSDFNKEASKAYGVLYDDYFGIKGVPKRASFIIGNDGVIKYAEVLEDSGKLPDFKAIQKALMS